MAIRYYVDPETARPHIERHGVQPGEVEDVLARPLEDRPGRDESRVAIGRTRAGRYVRVIYVPEETGDLFVITAYTLTGGALRALRRRVRRRRSP